MRKKEGILYDLSNFLESGKKEIKVPNTGPQLNCGAQILSDLWHFRYPLKYFPKHLKLIIKIPIFHLLKFIPPSSLKNSIYRIFGVKIARGVIITFNVYLDVFFPELITIEDGAIIGEYTKIFTHEALINHIKFGKVHIGKKVVVGLNSVVRCGTIISDGSVVAMNSLVNKDVPEMEVVGGVPIRRIKKLKKIL